MPPKPRQQSPTRLPADPGPPELPARPRRVPPRCNALTGKNWLQNSISVWSDIRKTTEEMRLKHPAIFPTALVTRLIETFLPPGGRTVLDPFAGCGSTLVAAERLGKEGIGLEISPEYASVALQRISAARTAGEDADVASGPSLEQESTGRKPPQEPGTTTLHQASATDLLRLIPAASIDLCITSPPYWNILNQRRTADFKGVRHYGNLAGDLGTIEDYQEFLQALTAVFVDVLQVLKPGAYCCVAVMDLRKKNRFYPFHSDLAALLATAGYIYDDLIIWNRQAEYNNLRPLGYPAVFRVNKVHEYILLMQKPKVARRSAS